MRHHGRSADLAAALGAEAAFIAVGTLTDRRTAPLRHLWQAARTLWLLIRRRPRVLLVMAPPAPLVLIGLVWSRITGARLVVDCHSRAVLGRPLSARLARHADLTIVTLPELATGFPRAVALHDAPVQAGSSAPPNELVVFPASWYADEPVHDVLGAARLLPDVRFAITGRAPQGIEVPDNVTLTGYLSSPSYCDLVGGCRLVLALTTRSDTMQRAAYEAVAYGRPVVASDHAGLREYLDGAAVYTTGGAADLAAALSTALTHREELAHAAVAVRARQTELFTRGLLTIVESVGR
jgi:glycosyltransferase involved in cell wall biosynthesis